MDYLDKKWTCRDLMHLHNAPIRMMFPLRMYYLYLSMTLISLAMGTFADLIWEPGAGWTAFALILSIIALSREVTQGLLVLLVAAFSAGASAYPLLRLVPITHKWLMFPAFMGLSVAPCWFLILALITRHRCCLYFWASLLSVVTVIILSHFPPVVFFVTDKNLLDYLLFYVLFLLYMVLNSQQIIFEAGLRTIPYMRATLNFFTDFPAVCFRIVYLLCVMIGELRRKDAHDSRKNRKKKKRN